VGEQKSSAQPDDKPAPVPSGCGDHSCVFGPPKGMGTNGGCRCLKDIRPTEKRIRVERDIRSLRAALTRAEEDIGNAKAEIANFDAIRSQDRNVGILLVEIAGLLGMQCEVNSESILRRVIEELRRA